MKTRFIELNTLLENCRNGQERHALRNFNMAGKSVGKPASLRKLLDGFSVDVEQVVMKRGHNGRLTTGASLMSDGGLVIQVNRALTNKGKRFTVLHELAHLILHRDRTDVLAFDKNYDAAGFYLSDEQVEEREANQGAAAMVFDHGALIAAKSLFGSDIAKLSDFFGVTEAVVRRGLSNT